MIKSKQIIREILTKSKELSEPGVNASKKQYLRMRYFTQISIFEYDILHPDFLWVICTELVVIHYLLQLKRITFSRPFP